MDKETAAGETSIRARATAREIEIETDLADETAIQLQRDSY